MQHPFMKIKQRAIDLVSSWVPRAKYVDDLTVLQVVPRNSPSMLNFIVNEIESYAISNNMRLDPSKCKELSVGFLRYNSCSWQPITVGGAFFEGVSCFKLLGLPIATRLSRGPTGDCMLSECLRIVPCQCKISRLSTARSFVLFSSTRVLYLPTYLIPQYLSNALENIQKCALGIIVPSMS